MDALLFPRKEVRYVAAMAASRLKPGAGASVGPLKFTQLDPPELPGDGWEHVTTRLAGICGSDLATIDGQASRYFEALVSFPFIPGHEVVGERADGTVLCLNLFLGPKLVARCLLGLVLLKPMAMTTGIWHQELLNLDCRLALVPARVAVGQRSLLPMRASSTRSLTS